MKVNVGTIGHVDHGKATLTQALVRVLGQEMADQVVIVDDASAKKLKKEGMIRNSVTEVVASCYGDLFGRGPNPSRKAERKARMKALMFKSAGGRHG